MVVGALGAPSKEFTEIPSTIDLCHWDLVIPRIIRELVQE
jgi:hypothetical protein